jgi:hypothetical protein
VLAPRVVIRRRSGQDIFGVGPSGRWWTGMQIFAFDGSKVRDLNVLGDIYGLAYAFSLAA